MPSLLAPGIASVLTAAGVGAQTAATLASVGLYAGTSLSTYAISKPVARR